MYNATRAIAYSISAILPSMRWKISVNWIWLEHDCWCSHKMMNARVIDWICILYMVRVFYIRMCGCIHICNELTWIIWMNAIHYAMHSWLKWNEIALRSFPTLIDVCCVDGLPALPTLHHLSLAHTQQHTTAWMCVILIYAMFWF